ncbi:hypothetical protein [Treponema sp. OMZ 305]|uniref:InlB B-repeat-containing protein n=1 Tax=Treponema sp. OMZ 305 TaxID=1659192 RepID=UPI0020A42B58|nr:hypothetical protein [Treponema sp. OMZ 305]
MAVLAIASLFMFTACPRSTDSVVPNEVPTVDKFTVNFSVDGEHGTLTAKVNDVAIGTGTKVEKDKKVSFTATPDKNYKVKEWRVGGSAVTGNTSSSYTHTVTKAVEVKVSFESLPVGQASYIVQHYKEKSEGGYSVVPSDTESLHDTAGATAVYTPKTFEGFNYNSSLTKINDSVQTSGTINADGSTVVKLYYERKTVNVTFKLNGGNVSGNTADIPLTGKFGTAFTAPEPVKADAELKGWNPALPSPTTFPAADTTYTAQWQITSGGGGKIFIKYNAENLTVRYEKNDRYELLPPNSEVSEGMLLRFRDKNIPAGQQVDKWKVNTKELDYDDYTVNVADAVSEGSNKVITVTYTTKPAAAVVVKFDESKVEVYKNGSGTLNNEATVYEGALLWFELLNPPEGQQVDKWKINAKELDDDDYTVNAADAVSDGSNKVITVTYTTKPAAAVVVKFDESKVKVYKNGSGTLNNEATVYEGALLWFELLNPPEGQQVDKWKVNTKELDYDDYTVNVADAVSEGSNKVITVTYTTKPAAAVVVKFDESKVEVYKNGSGTLNNGATVYEGVSLWFGVKSLPTGQVFDKWLINGTKEVKEHYLYTVNIADAVPDGLDKVITVTYTTKLSAGSVVIKFDPTLVKVVAPLSGMNDIATGQTIDAGTQLRVYPQVPGGIDIDKILFNTREYTYKHDGIYTLDINDAVQEGGNKVVRIGFTVKHPQVLTAQFTPAASIECRTVTGEAITSGDEGSAYLYAILKAKLSPGQVVKHWEVNGTKIPGSERQTILEGQANPAFAVEEGGKKVVKVNLVLE